MTVMPAGIVTLLGALLWVPTPRLASGENPYRFGLGLDDGGALRRYLLGGVVVELRFTSVSFWCLWSQVLVFLILFCLS
jgi:hypothetical protein